MSIRLIIVLYTVKNISKSGKNQKYNFTLKETLISVDCDMNRICSSIKKYIYSLWIYNGSVLQSSGWSAREQCC